MSILSFSLQGDTTERITAWEHEIAMDTTMVGSIGRCFDLGSVSEGIPEPRAQVRRSCSVGVPSVREGEGWQSGNGHGWCNRKLLRPGDRE